MRDCLTAVPSNSRTAVGFINVETLSLPPVPMADAVDKPESGKLMEAPEGMTGEVGKPVAYAPPCSIVDTIELSSEKGKSLDCVAVTPESPSDPVACEPKP